MFRDDHENQLALKKLHLCIVPSLPQVIHTIGKNGTSRSLTMDELRGTVKADRERFKIAETAEGSETETPGRVKTKV